MSPVADVVRDPDASRRDGPTLEDALGQMPGLPFITNDKAPRPSGGADAAIADLHHPATEEIGPGLDAVLTGTAAGGISGFEGDAEVEHWSVKKTFVYLTSSRHLDFLAFCG